MIYIKKSNRFSLGWTPRTWLLLSAALQLEWKAWEFCCTSWIKLEISSQRMGLVYWTPNLSSAGSSDLWGTNKMKWLFGVWLWYHEIGSCGGGSAQTQGCPGLGDEKPDTTWISHPIPNADITLRNCKQAELKIYISPLLLHASILYEMHQPGDSWIIMEPDSVQSKHSLYHMGI